MQFLASFVNYLGIVSEEFFQILFCNLSCMYTDVSVSWEMRAILSLTSHDDSIVVQENRKGALTVDTLHDAMWLFIVVPFVSFICGSCNAFALCIFELVHWDNLLFVWPTWVLGDLSAILCVAPCILHLWNIFHPDMLPIWGQPTESRARVELSRVDDESPHGIESDDGRRPSNVVEGHMHSGVRRSLHSGVQLLPWNGSGIIQEDSIRSKGAEFFSEANFLERDDDTDMESAMMKDRSPVPRRNISLNERVEILKGRWNKWVLDRRQKLCIGEKPDLLLEEINLSSAEDGLVYERSLPRSN